MINEDWTRWISASVAQHFIAALDPIYVYLETTERFTDKKKEWVEVRVDGPDCQEVSKGQFHLYIEVNLALVGISNPSDGQKFDRLIGKVISNFPKNMPIYRYGDQAVDDGSLVFCMTLLVDDREKIRVSRSGQVEPRTPVIQATVEGHYEAYVEN